MSSSDPCNCDFSRALSPFLFTPPTERMSDPAPPHMSANVVRTSATPERRIALEHLIIEARVAEREWRGVNEERADAFGWAGMLLGRIT